MKNIKIINTNVGPVPATIELSDEGDFVYIGKVVGFDDFFCYSDSEESLEEALIISFDIYLDILLTEDLKNLGVSFGESDSDI